MSEYVFDVSVFESEELDDGIREEIVRCRDCAHYTDDEMEYYHYCGNWCEQVEPDGFCAWGERE